MKKWMVVVGMMMVSEISFCQSWDWYYNFENWTAVEPLFIDTIANPNNIWQIGPPQKQILNTAYSNPNVIITDTINSYPINDTSSFVIKHIANLGLASDAAAYIAGHYFVNSDSLVDYGRIEFSGDNGTTWIDLVHDSLNSGCPYWNTFKPILTGNSNGWQYFEVWIGCVNLFFNIQYGDSVVYRFTFISDSIQTNKDGLMFDDLHFEDYAEGIQEIQNNSLLHLSPNPASDQLHISFDQPVTNGNVCIISCEGKVMSCEEVNTNSAALDVSSLPAGMYYVHFRNENMVAVRKVIVLH